MQNNKKKRNAPLCLLSCITHLKAIFFRVAKNVVLQMYPNSRCTSCITAGSRKVGVKHVAQCTWRVTYSNIRKGNNSGG